MALILHLTDLHLGDAGNGQEMDDHKLGLIPHDERVSRTLLIRNTLRQLRVQCVQNSETLDAVVVSGDITKNNDPGGYAEFSSVLEELGDQLPPPRRILVVPGNHDVAWETAPSSVARYVNFIEYVRSKGFITPLLDGVDEAKDHAEKNLLRLDEGAVEVVALNSSNYCGTRVLPPIPPSGFIPASDARGNDEPADLARVSPWQLESWATYFAQTDSSTEESTKPFLRIAVLHHQLLPVTSREELKPFESLINLGTFRYFLRAHNFHTVLHGHKHASTVYWDHISPPGQSGPHPSIAHKVLVISGTTVTRGSSEVEVARLLRFVPGNAPRCEIRRLEGVEPGAKVVLTPKISFPFWAGSDYEGRGLHNVVTGRNIDEVYERLLFLIEDRADHGVLHDVYSAIQQAPLELHIPKAYPPIPESYPEARDTWFSEQVNWWQRPASRLNVPFTHGGRIFHYRGDHVNQLETCIRVLRKKVGTSRAFICLYDPLSDAREDGLKPKAPHFSSMQFWIDEEEGWPRLNCIGYFRKQEIRYWWSVNVGELARLQNHVHSALLSTIEGLRLGKLATFTSIVYAGSSYPRVAVPLIDRLLDQESTAVWKLAHVLAYPSSDKRLALCAQWDLVLSDLIPQLEPDPNGVPLPIVGLSELTDEVDRLSRFCQNPTMAEVSDLLITLRDANVRYAADLEKHDPTPATHKAWAQRCGDLVGKLRNQIHLILRPDDEVV
jgi:3',5'-cyclic AMP phosphodiesterase CpdA